MKIIKHDGSGDTISREHIVSLIQKYIPLILENKIYFKILVDYLLKEYNFEINEEHLRKKLNTFLKYSFREEPELRVIQSFIKGEYCDYSSEVDYIWCGGEDIALITYNIVKNERS